VRSYKLHVFKGDLLFRLINIQLTNTSFFRKQDCLHCVLWNLNQFLCFRLLLFIVIFKHASQEENCCSWWWKCKKSQGKCCLWHGTWRFWIRLVKARVLGVTARADITVPSECIHTPQLLSHFVFCYSLNLKWTKFNCLFFVTDRQKNTPQWQSEKMFLEFFTN